MQPFIMGRHASGARRWRLARIAFATALGWAGAQSLVACTCLAPRSDEEVGKRDAVGGESPGQGAAGHLAKGAAPPLPAGPIALVNGQPINRDRFEELLNAQLGAILKRRNDGQVPGDTQVYLRNQVAQRLIWQQLLALEAQASKIDFTPAQWMAYVARQRVENWNEFLAMSLETEASWQEMSTAFLREQALLKHRGSLEATPAEIDAAYEERRDAYRSDSERVWAAHIEIVVGPRSQPTAKIMEPSRAMRDAATPEERAKWEALALARAQALRAQLLATNADFFEFVRDHSEGPGTSRGGDMGVFDRRRMIPEYSDAVFALKVGEVSQPVATSRGYYVIKLLGKWPAGVLPKEAVAADLRRSIEAHKYSQRKAELEAELSAKFPVLNYLTKDGAAAAAAAAPAAQSNAG